MPHRSFNALAEKHKDAVYRQMLRACGNHDDAEDVLVEALLRAYSHIDDLSDPEQFRAWLAAIGRRVCGQLRHKEALKPILSLDAIGEIGVSDSIDAALLRDELHNAVAHIPEGLRVVYKLRDIDGFSGLETAKRLGISLQAVKSRLHRARQALRLQIDHQLSVP